MTTVRAARLHKHRAPLKIETIELPEPREGEVLVDLAFAGVNPIDRYTADGSVAPEGPLPRTLGFEAAGVLDGRPVVVHGEGLGTARDGVWAQAAVVPREAVTDVPEGVDLRDAAAVGVVGVTAWNVVHDVGQLGGDDRVLVLGASGGVGCAIVSLAHATGATVWGQTSSAEKTRVIEEQGADRVIVTGPERLTEELGDFEPTVVLDALGGGFVDSALEALAVRGRLVVYGTSAGPEVTFNLRQLYRKRISLLGYGGTALTREERREGTQRALEALARGELKLPIHDRLALEQVNEAFERLAARTVRGKLLLELDGP
jgi:NADPH2:quinone reductase